MGSHSKLLENVKQHLCTCAAGLKLTPDMEAFLEMPMRELYVSLPIQMDNGSIKVFKGFRVQYNEALGPMKGGVRIHPDETIETIRALAALMTWKCALHRLPLGGAKGGVVCNPKELSHREIERLSRACIREFTRRMYRCNNCGYLYNPDLGDSSQSIDLDTPFQSLPKSWKCPRCGAPKKSSKNYDKRSSIRPILTEKKKNLDLNYYGPDDAI